MTSQPLQGLRILVVEDNFLVADTLRELLEGSDCQVAGPVGRRAPALVLVKEGPLDGAFLDINLAGETCFPIAAALRARGVPFFFLTGYSDGAIIPAEFRDVPRLSKPFSTDELLTLAAQQFSRPPTKTA